MKSFVVNVLIPPGYEVIRCEDLYKVWYEAQFRSRSLGNFCYENEAVKACVKDQAERGWAKSRYDIIAADEEQQASEKPSEGCCQCGKTKHEDGSEILWECQMCNRTVCRDCTLVIPGSYPREYFFQTLCSHECWLRAGRPEE